MTPIDDNRPAFASIHEHWDSDQERWRLDTTDGMSLRQYAAIALKVPDSGLPWLDDMIRRAKRDELAARAMQAGMVRWIERNEDHNWDFKCQSIANLSKDVATAMLAEGAKQ